MKDKLKSLVGQRKLVKISRDMPTDPSIDGYLVDMSDSLVLLHAFYDFMPNGWTILRIADVTGVRHCPYEEWFDHIYQAEGLVGSLDLSPKTDLTDMRSAITTVCAQYGQIIIECEETGEDAEDFYLGRLVDADEETVRLLTYDALGFWQKEPSCISLSEVTMVQFNTRYIRTFAKYTREGTPPDFPEY